MAADILDPHWPAPANIAGFSYSKLSHFELFRGLPFQSYNVGDPDPAICDLKVYQDYLTYCFIRRNVRPGSRILEVGGGNSRIPSWNTPPKTESLTTRLAPLAEIEADPDTYAMSQQAYVSTAINFGPPSDNKIDPLYSRVPA